MFLKGICIYKDPPPAFISTESVTASYSSAVDADTCVFQFDDDIALSIGKAKPQQRTSSSSKVVASMVSILALLSIVRRDTTPPVFRVLSIGHPGWVPRPSHTEASA